MAFGIERSLRFTSVIKELKFDEQDRGSVAIRFILQILGRPEVGPVKAHLATFQLHITYLHSFQSR